MEPQVLSEGRTFPGRYLIGDEGVALKRARNWSAGGTIWTDGSRLGNGRVGAACAWKAHEGWTGRRFNLGSSKETFSTYQALRLFDARQETERKYTVFSDS